MRLWCLCIVIVILVLTSIVSAARNYSIDVGLSSAYTANLLKDSSNLTENYSTVGVSLNLYPISFTEINLLSEYTYYGELFNLSNLLYGAGITFIPTSDSSRTSLYISSSFNNRKYRQEDFQVTTNEFNSKEIASTVALGQEINRYLRLRTGFSFKMTGYENDEINDKKTYEFFTGYNISFFGSNSFDLEAGYTTGNLDYLFDSTRQYPIRPGEEYILLNERSLTSFYFSPRFSRPLGKRTGLSITYSHRKFVEGNEKAIIYGYSTGLLSPWVQDYEGEAMLLNIKSYLKPLLVVTVGFGYWEKTYLKTLERDLDMFTRQPSAILSTYFAKERNDIQRRFYVRFQLPMKAHSRILFEPTVQVDYTSNTSSIIVYDYSDFSISANFNIKL